MRKMCNHLEAHPQRRITNNFISNKLDLHFIGFYL